MKTINYFFNKENRLRKPYVLLLMMIMVSIGSLPLFGQGTPTAFENLTTVGYDDCTGIATVQFPVRENFSICGQADQLRWLDVKAVPPNSGTPIFVGRVWKSSLTSNPCSGGSSFTILACRTYNYCNIPAGDLSIINGTGDQRFVKLTIKNLPEVFFGAATKFSFTGHYDYECCEGTNATHSTQGYTIPLFEKSVTGNSATVPQASISQTSEIDCQKTMITWGTVTPPGSCGTVRYDLWRGGYGFIAQAISGTSFTDPGLPLNYLPPGTYQYQIRSRWIPQGSSREDFSEWSAVGGAANVTIQQPNGSITVNLKTGSGTPINGESALATRISYGPSSICPALIPAASINLGTTTGNGSVTKNEIYYGHENEGPTVYRISIVGKPHIPTKDVTLDFTPNNSQTVTLIDTTAYSVTGRLLSAGGCGIAGAEISADGHAPSNLAPITKDTTDQYGDFTLVLPGPDNYGFYSSFKTPTGNIVMDSTNMTINMSSGQYVPIQYSKSDTVRGFVGGECMAIYGPATINAYAQSGGCLIASTTSNSTTGLYELILPSHEVDIKVENYEPIIGTPLYPQSLDQEIEVGLDSTTIIDFIFQAPITVEFSGFPAQACSDIPHPIMEQGKLYPIILTVTEGNGCPIDTGYVIVQDEISGYDGQNLITDTVYISDGFAVYYLYPATPNIFSPYTKPITFTAYSGIATSAARDTAAIVTGASPRGNQFATVSPQIPRIILRDPPGADSYSFMNSGETFSTTTKMFSQHGEGGKTWLKAHAGVDQRIFGVRIEANIDVGLNISGSKTQLNSDEILFEFKTEERFTTSSNNQISGTDGDVYVGAAMNLTYANSDIISFDLAKCEINKRVELVIHPDSFATEFALSESYIQEFTIPDLQTIANDVTQSDSARHLAQQSVNVWNQIINLNARLKEEAFDGPGVTSNYTFSNTEIERTFTSTNSETATIEWTSLIEESVAIEAGFAVNGNGLSGGVEVNFKQEFGESKSNTTTTSTTTGFLLKDDTPNDSYTIDWAFDPVYGTPVFRPANNAGQTSCPWELGVKRNKTFFSVPNPVQTSASNSVSFPIWLGNQSETEEDGDYVLEMISNPDNAVVQINGTNGPLWLFNDMEYQDPQSLGYEVVNVIVTKPNNEFYQFEGIQFKFYPACDPSRAARNSFSVFFDSPCSDIAMVTPTINSGFIINNNSGNKQPIKIGGYTYNDIQSGDEIVMQYAPTQTNSWSTSNIVLSKSQISSNSSIGATTTWLTDAIQDGSYDIRMKLTCTAGPNQTSTYSPRVSGIIDRTPPEVLGTTEPEDDDYAMGDEISVLFNEVVVASNATLTLTMLPDDITVTASLILDSNKISVVPSVDISTEIGKIFDVDIAGIEDQYSNETDPITWSFTVGEIDTDGDGYTDNYEQCIGSALHFDHPQSSHVVVPHNNALNVVESGLDFTFEAWVFPSPRNLNTIIAKGTGVGGVNENEFIFTQRTIGGVDLRLSLYLANEWRYGNSSVPQNQWSHVAVTFDAATKQAQFYINGIPDGNPTFALATPTTGNTDPLYIGRIGTANGGYGYADGRMDDVTIWQHKLTQAEIMATMAGALTGAEPDLVAHYDFNDSESCKPDTSNTAASDKSPNNFNGTLTNFSLDGCSSNWATERSMDNDRDGIPDGCDEIEPCFDLSDPGDTDGDLLLACADLCPSTKDVALDFIGNNNFLAFNHTGSIADTNFAFSAWVNPVTDEETGIFFGQDSDVNPSYGLILRNQKIVLVLFESMTSNKTEYLGSITDVPLNTWSHIAVSFDATTKEATFYLNGEFDGVDKSELNSIYSPSNNTLLIGVERDSFGVSSFYNGRMDDINIWSRTLSEYNINQIMAAPLSGLENGLVAYFDFNEGVACADNTTITTALNKNTSNNNATLIGFNKTTCTSNYVMGRNLDSDSDMIGDACDVSGFGCPPNYAGANQLIGDQTYSTFFDTDGAIESTQRLKDPAGVIYNSDTSVELLPEFEVKLGSSLEIKFDGCPD